MGRSDPPSCAGRTQLSGRERPRRDCGGGLHRRRPARPGHRQLQLGHRLDPARQRRRDIPSARRLLDGSRHDSRCDRGGGLQRRRPARPGRRRVTALAPSRSCWAMATGRSSPPCFTRREDRLSTRRCDDCYTTPDAIVVGDFNGDGKLDLAVADQGSLRETVVYSDGSYLFHQRPGRRLDPAG